VTPTSVLGARAHQLRTEFERSFAEAPRALERDTENLLAIRVEADRYALRLSEIAGLFADRRVLAVPSQVRGLMGLAGLRGALLPVYDLRILLGYTPLETPRWLVVAASKSVAFAFDALDGYLRVERKDIAVADVAPNAHAPEVAAAGELRPIVRLASVLDAVEERCREANRRKGQER
jgi:purine-binding chemotaxis protein CheW